MKNIKKKKIAYVINHASFFYSHILPIALKAKKKYDITLFHGLFGSQVMESYALKQLEKLKIKKKEIKIIPGSLNILNEVKSLIQLYFLLKKYNPDLIHCATPKGIFYGGIISRILKIKSIVIFNSGMGFLFSNKLSLFEKFAKYFYTFVLNSFILKQKNKRIIIENKDDYKFFKKQYNLKTKEIVLVRGSGVDLKKIKKISISTNKIVLLPSRVIKEKGIMEFVKAAEKLKKKYPSWKFIIAGALDYRKKSKFSNSEIHFFKRSNSVSLVGFVKNIYSLYEQAGIVCLPSYREGFSKVLQEAAAMGIPIVTTNVIGCKDSIIPGKTGELCEPQNSKSLEKKLEYLILNKRIRMQYSKNARKFAEKYFDLKNVISNNIEQYKILMKNE